MLINNPEKSVLETYFNNLNQYIGQKDLVWTKYVDLGCKTVRILCFSDEFTPHVQKQLTYTLKDYSPKYDATLIIWKDEFKNLAKEIDPKLDLKTNFRLRIELLAYKRKNIDLLILENNIPILQLDTTREILSAFDSNTNTYFYGVKNLEPEEFIKEGHIFVQAFNKIVKTPNSNLVHGAVVGLNNQGILFCARGQRGKSTLAVLSMMKGFEYVSDDYLILQKEGNELFTHPIYSIITLSPRMYNELYNELEGTRFVSNNARKDKYVINISNFHHTFRKKYPVKICMFPEIVDDKEPSITLCTPQEKGRAIVHLVHSTIIQTQDKHDIQTVRKIMDMVKGFEFYKINLCSDIYKNVEYLREFTERTMKNDKLCIK